LRHFQMEVDNQKRLAPEGRQFKRRRSLGESHAPPKVQVVLTFAQTENDLTVVNAGFYINIAALS